MESAQQLQYLLAEPLTPQGKRLVNSALLSFEREESIDAKTQKCLEVSKWWQRTYRTAARFAVIKAHMSLLQGFLIAKLCEDYLEIAYHIPPRIDDLAGILQDERTAGVSALGDDLIRSPLEQLDVDVHHAEARLVQIKHRGSSANDLSYLKQSGMHERWEDFVRGDKHLLDDLKRSGSIEEGIYKRLRAKIYSDEDEKPNSWFPWWTSNT